MYKHAKFYPCSKKIPKSPIEFKKTVNNLIELLRNKKISEKLFMPIIESWNDSQIRKWEKDGTVDYRLYYTLKGYDIDVVMNKK